MKKYYIYGNCQARILSLALNESSKWRNEFELAKDILGIHLIKKKDILELHSMLKDIDLFIYQNVTNSFDERLTTEYIKTILKPSCQLISFPSAYFKGYNPEIVYIKDRRGQKIASPTGGYDFFILHAYLTNTIDTEKLSKNYYKNNFLNNFFLNNYFQVTINELMKREIGLDIKLSSFIKKNWTSCQLFHTVNHPTNKTIFYIVDQILKHVNLEVLTSKESSKIYEFQGWNRIPIYQDIINSFKLKGYNKRILIAKKDFEIVDYINEQLKIFNELDRKLLIDNYNSFIENDQIISFLYQGIK
jgi:hypothetical protein